MSNSVVELEPRGVEPPPSGLPGGDGATARPRSAPLDGIRAVAVAAVFLFHAGVVWAPGGLLGVDVFFVLSGYLITSLLLAEHARTGTISLRHFWARRVRRLLPAALAMVAVTFAVWVATSASTRLVSLRGDVLATLGYVANWRFAFTGQGYFNHYDAPSPLLHMWSLAVEEQFYLVWPVVLVLLLRRVGPARARGVVARISVLGIVASTTLCAVLAATGTGKDRLYYGTDTRATTLLVGALLACFLPLGRLSSGSSRSSRSSESRAPRGAHRRRGTDRPLRTGPAVVLSLLGVAAVAALVRIIGTLEGTSPILYRGGFLVVALLVAVTILAVVRLPGGPLARLLALPPLVGLGRISYAVYLWHWPVILYLTGARTGVEGVRLLTLRAGVTLALAAFSWFLLERPIQLGRLRLPKPRFAVPALVGAVAAAVVLAPLPSVPPSDTPDLQALAQLQAPPPPVGTSPVQDRPARVLLVGDSVALTLGVGLETVAKQEGIVFAGRGFVGCGVATGGPIRFQGVLGQPTDRCDDILGYWANSAAQVKPDVTAVLVGRWELVDREYAGKIRAVGDPVYDQYLVDRLTAGVDGLLQRGSRVALLTPTCSAPHETANGTTANEDDPARLQRFTALVRQVAASYPPQQVQLYDLAAQVCPGGAYRTRAADGTIVRTSDGIHITPKGGVLIGQWLLPQLASFSRETPRP